ncbi:Integrase core domain [Moraxella equi]|uniref:Integrase core domain n=2 Tax=Moraxella equi TaxID=60442 RepID=A0A378QUI8_9GAMM|nr:Integrase core domain [Moraxella equi]
MGIYKALKRLGITHKKNKRIHPKSDINKQLEYLAKLTAYQEQDHPIIYMDESGFEAHTYRPYGDAPIGQPSILYHNYQNSRLRADVIGALCHNQLFALSYHKHHTNTQTVYDWLEHTLIVKLKRKCVIVMDNAPFHKNKRIQKLLNRHGHRLLFLSPYSPDLNPIEYQWSQAKSLRQGWMTDDLDELFWNMGACGDFVVWGCT